MRRVGLLALVALAACGGPPTARVRLRVTNFVGTAAAHFGARGAVIHVAFAPTAADAGAVAREAFWPRTDPCELDVDLPSGGYAGGQLELRAWVLQCGGSAAREVVLARGDVPPFVAGTTAEPLEVRLAPVGVDCE